MCLKKIHGNHMIMKSSIFQMFTVYSGAIMALNTSSLTSVFEKLRFREGCEAQP